LLKLIVQHPPTRLSFLCALQLRLTKPQWQPVLHMADALIVSATRHKTIASLYRVIVAAPAPSHGADSLRRSPWTADDLRTPLRHLSVTDLVAYGHETNAWTLYVRLDDSLGAQDKGTRHLAAVEYHHDRTKRQATSHPSPRIGPCMWKAVSSLEHAPMRTIGASPSVSRMCGVSINNGSPSNGSACARKRRWPKRC
jgi:hypothetical protein